MIVVKACVRPEVGWRLLEKTCAAVDEQLAGRSFEKLIVTDQDSPPGITGWPLHVHAGDRGSRATGWKTLQLARGADFLLHLEDDLIFAPGALEDMLATKEDDLDFVSFFHPREPKQRTMVVPFMEVKPNEKFRFSQAVMFPGRTLARLLETGLETGAIMPEGSPHGFDQAVANALGGGRHGVRWPNLVEHAGQNELSSILRPPGKGTAVSGWFKGPVPVDFDAWLKS